MSELALAQDSFEPWDFSRLDWEKRLMAGESLMPDLPLFEEDAAAGLQAFLSLRMPSAPGVPTLAECVDPWFREIVLALFGSHDRSLNLRMINEIFVLVPKKNGKSVLSAAIMLVALLMNRRRGAEFFLIGPSQSIAGTSFEAAFLMIEADPRLKKRLDAKWHTKEIIHRDTGAKLRVKSFDNKVVTGKNIAGVLLDELWEMSRNKHAASVLRQIKGGTLANPEAFCISISTQSDFEPQGVFRDALLEGREIRDGKRKGGRTLAIIYEYPANVQESGEWKNPALWHLVNPSLGRAVTLHGLQDLYEKERHKGDAAINAWASQHLNIEIGLGRASQNRWAGTDHWLKNSSPFLTVDQILEWSDVVTSSIDGGGYDDMMGLGILGRHKISKIWMLWCKAWVCRSVLDLRPEMAPKLLDLEAAGEVGIFEPESNSHMVEMCGILSKIESRGLFPEENAVAIDDSTGLKAFIEEIEMLTGMGHDRFVNISQGPRLMDAIKTMEMKLARGEIVHADQALMRWCVANARIVRKGNLMMIAKDCSVGKIDPLMASFSCVKIMSQDPEAAGAYGNPTILVH